MHRLGQNLKLVALRARLLQQIGGGSLAGEEQNLDARQQRPYPNRRVDSVQPAHNHVGDEHLRDKLAGNFHSLLAGIGHPRIKAIFVQDHRQRVCDHPFIIGDEHFRFVRAIRHCPRPSVFELAPVRPGNRDVNCPD